ncbi:MAG: lipocalin-like domain-containing protein [Bacteroidota bacterium]
MKFRIFLLFIFFSTIICKSQTWKTYPYTPTESLISFPKDEGHHASEPIEWWYTTGHLKGKSTGTNYSYMLSYFFYTYQGFDGFRILNITNDDTGEKYFNTSPVKYDVLSEDKLQIQASSALFLPKTEKWKNKEDGNNKIIPFEYTINAASDKAEIDLEYITVKRPLILGDDGKFDQGASSYTYYYSLTKNEVTGKIIFNGSTEDVTGTSWIDRQYGSLNPLEDEKYEWMSIQLSNGMDINLWNLFTDDDKIPDNLNYKLLSAYVDENTQYTIMDFVLERLEYHFTPDKERCYSQKWRLTSDKNNIDLIISVLHKDSEVQLPFRFYEGATSITGNVNGVAVTGKGFAELLHSYEVPEINITHPNNGTFNSSENITWNVTNPDEGNPLLFDVEYSIDDKQTFKKIAEGISETSFLWENPDILTGENIWFKIIAYSVDKTLVGSNESTNSSSFTLPVEDFNKNNFVLFPNPGDDFLQINFNQVFPNLTYQIIDVNGRILINNEEKNIKNLEIDIKSLGKGLYFLKVTHQNKNLHTKFLVE